MFSRSASLGLASSLLSAAALAGCSAPPAPPARFADASLAQLDRAFTASTGLELMSAVIFSSELADRQVPTACPAIVTEGPDTIVTGGCTTEEGVRLDGSVVIHNLWSLDDPSQPSSFDLDYHITTREGRRIALVGHVELDSPEPSGYVLRSASLRGDLTIDVGGIESTSHMDIRCDAAGMCTALPGSEIAISDLGGATVEGAWSLLESPAGRLSLRGEAELVLDIAGRTDDGCVPYELGDQRGTVCRSKFFQPLGVFEH